MFPQSANLEYAYNQPMTQEKKPPKNPKWLDNRSFQALATQKIENSWLNRKRGSPEIFTDNDGIDP